MKIENAVKEKISELLKHSETLKIGNPYGQISNAAHGTACIAWIASAHNIVYQLCRDPENPYRRQFDKIAMGDHDLLVHRSIAILAGILKNMHSDVTAGLLGSIADYTSAETFDNFLDHAKSYLDNGRKKEAGVIAGVVFEDSIRRFCRKLNIVEKGVPLDQLISALSSKGHLSAIKAKRARAAAHVRTKATHAQWDEFEANDVGAVVDFTREFIAEKFDQ